MWTNAMGPWQQVVHQPNIFPVDGLRVPESGWCRAGPWRSGRRLQPSLRGCDGERRLSTSGWLGDRTRNMEKLQSKTLSGDSAGRPYDCTDKMGGINPAPTFRTPPHPRPLPRRGGEGTCGTRTSTRSPGLAPVSLSARPWLQKSSSQPSLLTSAASFFGFASA